MEFPAIEKIRCKRFYLRIEPWICLTPNFLLNSVRKIVETQRVYTHPFLIFPFLFNFFVKNAAHWILPSFRFYLTTVQNAERKCRAMTTKNQLETWNNTVSSVFLKSRISEFYMPNYLIKLMTNLLKVPWNFHNFRKKYEVFLYYKIS